MIRDLNDVLPAPTAPRGQAGGSPQHLLVTLFGDYWMARDVALPSAALVALLEEFGISMVSARAALSRLGRRGVIDAERRGRNTLYRLNSAVSDRLRTSGRRILSFGTEDDWDDTWTIVVYSLPEEQRDVRHVLRSRLRWLGFASLYDGVWVSPRTDLDSVSQVLQELNVRSSTVFTASHRALIPLGRAPLEAWDLDAVRATYDEFIANGESTLRTLREGRATPAEALTLRTTLMDVYRGIPAIDPGLPLSQMPERWPRRDARELFIELYDGLAPLAELRVRQIVSEFDTDAASLARPNLSSDLLAGSR